MGSAGGNWKALFEAAKTNDLEELTYWLSAGTDPNAQHVEFGTTPLIAAAEKGHLEVVKALVEGGADPAVRSDWDRHTALEAARKADHAAIVAWLESR
ncbi:MAG: ankyrin repeat domain-containing protein [Myxococcota bacterium]